MISRYAIDTIEELQKEGLRLAPADIIRLNALGLKIDRGPDAANLYTKRRAVFLGTLTLREPTIAHALFLSDIRALPAFADIGEAGGVALRAWVLSMDAPPEKPLAAEDALAQVSAFITGPLANLTLAQVRSAVDYCINGFDSAAFEHPAPADADPDSLEETADDWAHLRDFSYELGLVTQSQTLRLGLTAAEAKSMSARQLAAIVERASDLAALNRSDNERMAYFREKKNRYISEFDRTVGEMRMRLLAAASQEKAPKGERQ